VLSLSFQFVCFSQKLHLPPSVPDNDQTTPAEENEEEDEEGDELLYTRSTDGCCSAQSAVLDF